MRAFGSQPFRLQRKPASPVTRESKSPAPKGEVYPVWFGTNRKPTADGKGFTSERLEQITRGRVDVFIPKGHRFGETGTPLWKKLLRRDLSDDELRIQRLLVLGNEGFYMEVQQAIATVRRAGETSHALLYLHGYNVPFKDAAIRAAQLGYDLKVSGATAFFSWPSHGRTVKYPADEQAIEESEAAITEFLEEFAANCKADKIHIVAHSMGNRGLLRTMQRIAAKAQSDTRLKFGQIFLAAPDVSRGIFLDLAKLYPQFADRTTLYASNGDKAVWLSKKLHGDRAGYFKPYTVVAGVDTIAVPNFNIDLLGHSYYAQAEALLHDMHDLMRRNEPPIKRQRLKPAISDGLDYWELQK